MLMKLTKGGVILIGGYTDTYHLDSLYQLSDIATEWKLMKQTLKIARSYHSAILIPDEVTNCYSGKLKNMDMVYLDVGKVKAG